MSDLAEKLRPYQIREDAVTSPEFAEAWGLSEPQTRKLVQRLVRDGKLMAVKTRREYQGFSKVVTGYVEPDGA